MPNSIYKQLALTIIFPLALCYISLAPFIYTELSLASQSDIQAQNQAIFQGVKERLIKDGFSSDDIDKIYSNPKVALELKGVSLFFVHSESKLNYEQFLSDKAISSAAQYMKEHQAELDNAQSIYGVDKTVITAIMLVETRLGSYLGNREVINILSTMSGLSETSNREQLWDFLSTEKRIAKDKFEKKADSKSEWAYKELKAFLKYAQRENFDPVEIKGSYAGALGIAQFMPSNALTLAKDGNLDGKVDLFDHTDAIHSIANYLKKHGWKPSLSREQAHKVLYRYNHSTPYVETLLAISDRLKASTN
ncbi:MAG: lytic murein transglycosylase [Desulfamplus sp.]|nr:lytic murein transglycosylase [Desulfamplus sp.]